MVITGLNSNVARSATAETQPANTELDVVVGLPGADAASAVAATRAGLAAAAPGLRWKVVLARPATADATAPPDHYRAGDDDVATVTYDTHASDTLYVPFHRMQARGRALLAILKESRARACRACIVADPRAPLTAPWVEALLRPLLNDAVDLIKPLYQRHPFQGGVVGGIVSPLFRALYGVPVRHPLGTDFSCSRACIDAVWDDPFWETDQGQIGADWWLSATAATGGLRVGEAWLSGTTDSGPGPDISTTMTQVLGVCFTDMERRASTWHRVRHTRPLPHFGVQPALPPPPDVDIGDLADRFRLGARELEDVWAEVLPPLSILQWRRLARPGGDLPRVDDGLWARTVYDFALGHRLRVIARDHLLASLTPLYFGWLSSFVGEMRSQAAEAAEARLDRLAGVFEHEKPYLISQWRWPERFRPMKARR
jgi:hypothetical protein